MSEKQETPVDTENMSAKLAADEPASSNAPDAGKATTANKSGKVPGQRIHTLDDVICLQLRDTQLRCAPIQIVELFRHFDLHSMTGAEILFQLVYLAALESGFAEKSCFEHCADKLNLQQYLIASYFDAWNVYYLSLHKPNFHCEASGTKFRMQLYSLLLKAHPDANESLSFILSGIVTGDFMILTMTAFSKNTPIEDFSTQSVCLSIPRFIVGNTLRDNERPLQQRFRKLDELTDLLREQIFLPMQQYFSTLINIEWFPSLLGLPSELYNYIFHCLSPNELRILANVNKQLNCLVTNSKHYKRKAPVEKNISFLSRSQSSSSGSRYQFEPFF